MAPESDTARTDSSDRAPAKRGAADGKAAAARQQRKYERKSPRFVWPDELHQRFVTAIFDLGLKNASPKSLLALMAEAGVDADGLTTEHLKSHLQKYRINQERSRAEFLEFYNRASRRQRRRQRRRHRFGGAGPATKFVFPICSPSRRNVGQKEDSSSSESDSTIDRRSNRKDSRDSSRASTERTTCETSSSVRQQEPPFAADLLINAAAASMGQQQLPPGYMPGNQGGVPQSGAMLPEFTDPQWNVLMAPALSGLETSVDSLMLDPAGNGVSRQDATQSNMQTQMNLAMQAQMTLHRQMLSRKVEMAHHLAQQNRLQSSAAGYNGAWRSHAQQLHLQQQQQYLQQQRQLNLFSQTSQPAQASLGGPMSTATRPQPPALPQFGYAGPNLASGHSAATTARGPSDGMPNAEIPSKSDDESMNWDALSLEDDDLFSFLAA